MTNQPYLNQQPVECPLCGAHDWSQLQHYGATDKHWLTWQPTSPRYQFDYDTIGSSDEETEPWQCPSGHIAPDETQTLLNELV